MGLNNRKTISINMDIRDLANLDWICQKMSGDLGFRVSRTNALVLLCNEYLNGLDIGELERKQYRLSLDEKRPSNEAKRVD